MLNEAGQRLLEGIGPVPNPSKLQKTLTQMIIKKTFKGTSQLSNLLPTGSVLIFQYFSPILTNKGQCQTILNQTLTLVLIIFSCASCFLLSFTDSVRDARGKVRYALATKKGLWIVDGSVVEFSDEECDKYRLRFIDYLHGFLTMLAFGVVALFDQNVIRCFYPEPSDYIKEVLVKIPVAIGGVCSLLFIVFPSKRHGIGFPLSPE